MSNHARGREARSAHNIHVWRGGDYLGLGPGAHGRLTLDGVRTATVAHRRIGEHRGPCPAGCDRALDHALITAPEKRDPDMLAKLDVVAARVL